MQDTEFHIPPDLQRGPIADFLPASEEANWGMNSHVVRYLRDTYDGTGVITGIIDTGIDEDHPDLRGQVLGAWDFTNSRYGYSDMNGHGTHCSGTVGANVPNIGVAVGCKIVHGKGLGDNGSGSGSGIAKAMQKCVDAGAMILSMSLGSSSPDSYIDGAGRELTKQGIWIVCAAGNSGGDTQNVDYPGRFPWAISTAALDRFFRVASFSSAGAKIDTSAAGVNIWSCKPKGGYAQMSGTSMATPFAAGVLTLYRHGLMTLNRAIPDTEELQIILKTDSLDVYTEGDDDRTGSGAIWPQALMNNLTADPPLLGA